MLITTTFCMTKIGSLNTESRESSRFRQVWIVALREICQHNVMGIAGSLSSLEKGASFTVRSPGFCSSHINLLRVRVRRGGGGGGGVDTVFSNFLDSRTLKQPGLNRSIHSYLTKKKPVLIITQ